MKHITQFINESLSESADTIKDISKVKKGDTAKCYGGELWTVMDKAQFKDFDSLNKYSGGLDKDDFKDFGTKPNDWIVAVKHNEDNDTTIFTYGDDGAAVYESMNEATAPHPHQKELWDEYDTSASMSEKKSYKEFFQSKLDKYKVKSPAELKGDDKKKFFDEIDKEWDAVNESKYRLSRMLIENFGVKNPSELSESQRKEFITVLDRMNEQNSSGFVVFDTLKRAGIKSSEEDPNNFDYMNVPGDDLITPTSKKASLKIQKVFNREQILFRVDKTGNIEII